MKEVVFCGWQGVSGVVLLSTQYELNNFSANSFSKFRTVSEINHLKNWEKRQFYLFKRKTPQPINLSQILESRHDTFGGSLSISYETHHRWVTNNLSLSIFCKSNCLVVCNFKQFPISLVLTKSFYILHFSFFRAASVSTYSTQLFESHMSKSVVISEQTSWRE